MWNQTNWISNSHICVNFWLNHRCVDIASQNCKVSRWLLQNGEDTECRRKTGNKCLIGKTLTKRRNPRKRNGSTQWKKKEISIKTEAASSSMKPFEDWPVEHEEEASRRKYEVIGTDIEMEYEEMDTEDEECEVRKLTKEELEIYHQYKEFYTIQARTKGGKNIQPPYRRRSPGYKSNARTRNY